MNNIVEARVKFASPLVIGGTPVDDAIMDLMAISELAEDDPKARRVMDSLAELISVELAGLRVEKAGKGQK